jgi:hypothetical protein
MRDLGPRLREYAVPLALTALVVVAALVRFGTQATVVQTDVRMERRGLSIDQLQQQTRFAVLQASYLPAGCEAQDRFTTPSPPVAYLTFSCLTMTERAGDLDQFEDDSGQPFEDVVVADSLARYFDGVWIRHGEQPDARSWSTQFPQLVFTRNGVTVQLLSLGEVSRADMIKVAESMR